MKIKLSLLALFLPVALSFLDFDYSGSENRVKGPCPALNTLANHGLLPRDGLDVPIDDIIQHMTASYAVDSIDSIVSDFRSITRTKADGVDVLDFADLWVADVDSSFIHADLFFDPTGQPVPELLDGLEAAAGTDGILTHHELAEWRDIRIKDSIANNANLAFTVQDLDSMSFYATMLLYAFGDDPLIAEVKISHVTSFMRENRFPNDFVPRTHRGEPIRSWLKDPLLIGVQTFFRGRVAQLIPISYLSNRGPNMLACMSAIQGLQFDIFDYSQYPYYFREDSRVVLPEAGEYIGPAGIEEYVRFSDESSPYIEETKVLFRNLFFKSVDQNSRVCEFLAYSVRSIEFDSSLAIEGKTVGAALLQIHYDFDEQYIKEVDVHYEKPYLAHMFNSFRTNEIANFICDVSGSISCPNVNVGISHKECVQTLAALPTFTNGAVDGNGYGCRVLHAVFAEKNSDHCAHLSFKPMEDSNGDIKCQESKRIMSEALFDATDLQDFRDFLNEPQSLIESSDGFKIYEQPKPHKKGRHIILGAVVPAVVFFGAIYLFGGSAEEDPSLSREPKAVSALMANKARQLWIVILVCVACILVAFGSSGLVLWLIARNKDWDNHANPYENYLQDKYRGEPNRVAETVPLGLLDDEQFLVYAGILVWFTTVLTGLGTEVFVWYHFLQAWSVDRETLWRFVQFIFPMMLVTALGLASTRNFLCLPFLVFGLWKFGFPETMMFLYLGIFSKHNSTMSRASDFINGAGTVIHHSAAAMIVSMLVIGVIPASRYIYSGALILAVQHWFALVAYANAAVYTASLLVLEYYFQWIILSDFAEIYYLHWTAAWAAGTMIFAHWLYFTAGLLGMFAGVNAHGDDHSNVHTRGNKEMGSGKQQQNVPPGETNNLDVTTATTSVGRSRRASVRHSARESLRRPSRLPNLRDSMMQHPDLRVVDHLSSSCNLDAPVANHPRRNSSLARTMSRSMRTQNASMRLAEEFCFEQAEEMQYVIEGIEEDEYEESESQPLSTIVDRPLHTSEE